MATTLSCDVLRYTLPGASRGPCLVLDNLLSPASYWQCSPASGSEQAQVTAIPLSLPPGTHLPVLQPAGLRCPCCPTVTLTGSGTGSEADSLYAWFSGCHGGSTLCIEETERRHLSRAGVGSLAHLSAVHGPCPNPGCGFNTGFLLRTQPIPGAALFIEGGIVT